MKLTKSTDFAIRIVLKLADTQEWMTMPQLSEELHIPYNNLSKIVQQLTKGDILRTRQGKNGGISLARSSDQITLKTLVYLIDGPTRLSECMNEQSFCQLACNCRLKNAFYTIQTQIDGLFESVKISELVKEPCHESTSQ